MIHLLIQLFYVFAVLAVNFTLRLHLARLADCRRGCVIAAVTWFFRDARNRGYLYERITRLIRQRSNYRSGVQRSLG